jgi:MULE transposase domain
VYAEDGTISKHFCVIVAEQFGLAMLNAFGAGEDRMVLLDATGGTNKYGYQLYSLVVVDDFREGVPVAFMLTSSQEAGEVATFMTVSQCCTECGFSSPANSKCACLQLLPYCCGLWIVLD